MYLSELKINIPFTLLFLPLIGLPCTLAAAADPVEFPLLSTKFVGPPETVFDTRKQSCDSNDIPDANPRAFRDSRNRIHLVSTHYIARAMVGMSLDTVHQNCSSIYRSPQDPDPSHFRDRSWLMSFYTSDGRNIAALVHTEFEGWTFAGTCRFASTQPISRKLCWFNTITYAHSNDDGYTFTIDPAPYNLVASVPYKYNLGSTSGPLGYNTPTNIIKVGKYFYAFINAWSYGAQKYGSCLIRTASPFAANSWHAWNGRGFDVIFADPYTTPDVKPAEHVCKPVLSGETGSVAIHEDSGYFVTDEFTADNRYGLPGLYLSVSKDLIHWSRHVLVISKATLLHGEPHGSWTYSYFSIIDPLSRDRNFSTISDTPYIYYVRLDKLHPPLTRVLFRRKLKINFDGPTDSNAGSHD